MCSMRVYNFISSVNDLMPGGGAFPKRKNSQKMQKGSSFGYLRVYLWIPKMSFFRHPGVGSASIAVLLADNPMAPFDHSFQD
jgi:hypothetical protein